jgi:hypothetical protein
MRSRVNRRTFIKTSLLTSAGSALALRTVGGNVFAQGTAEEPPTASIYPASKAPLPEGKIGIEAWIQEQKERSKTGFVYADIRCHPYNVPRD